MNTHDDRDENANGNAPAGRPADDLLARSAAAMRDAVPPVDGPSPAAVAATLAALRGAADGPPKRQTTPRPGATRLGGFTRKMFTMTFTQRLAAAVMVAIGGVVRWMTFTLFSSVSYAQVADRIRATHAMRCLVTSDLAVPGAGPAGPIRLTFQDPGLLRQEMPGGVVSITDHASGRTLVLNEKDRSAQLVTVDQPKDAAHPGDVAETFRRLADQKDAKPLGEREIGGVKAKGFQVKEGGQLIAVWADAKSGTPVRVEFTFELGGKPVRLAMSDFEFDPPLAEGTFSLTPPAGYRLTERKATLNLNMADNAVAILRAYAETHEGRFPPQLTDPTIIAEVLKAGGGGAATKPDEAKVMQVGSAFGALTGWTFSAERGKDWDYSPEAAKLGDKDKLVFWHKDVETGKHRGVYGDLAVRDLAEAPPKR